MGLTEPARAKKPGRALARASQERLRADLAPRAADILRYHGLLACTPRR
jgi:hypothetical protein